MKVKKVISIGALFTLLVSAALIAGCKQNEGTDGGNSSESAWNPFVGTWESDDGLYKLVFAASTIDLYSRTSPNGNWAHEDSTAYTFSGNTATPQNTREHPHSFVIYAHMLRATNGQVFYKK